MGTATLPFSETRPRGKKKTLERLRLEPCVLLIGIREYGCPLRYPVAKLLHGARTPKGFMERSGLFPSRPDAGRFEIINKF